MNTIYIFSYGSLLNPECRKQFFAERDVIAPATLRGYQRKCNAVAPGVRDVGMNVVPNVEMSVAGLVLEVPESDLPELRKYEVGYQEVDISEATDLETDIPIVTYIAPDVALPDMIILQTYLDTCLGGVPTDQRQQWLEETILPYKIIDDRADPQYEYYVPLND